jgi:hypothetical protein
MPTIRAIQAAGWVAGGCVGLLILATASGCGRKLLPIRPGALPPPAIVDLTYEVRGSAVLLSWTVPAFDPAKESAAAGFKVLRARQSAEEADCGTCPPPFQVIADMTASGRAPGSRMRFRDALEPGLKHSYKLNAYADDGVAVRDSNAVAVTP